jgi:hypothetical protein
MLSNIASTSLIGFSCLSTIVSAAPFSFPLSNGFPTPSPDAINTIELAAHGSLPNGTPPPTLNNKDSLTSLQLIAFNELVEVAFFTELIANITAKYNGYDNWYKDQEQHDTILNALNAIVAQEELHELNANGAVVHFGGEKILPCNYNFPVNSFIDAIALASTFTDVVLGTLQDVESIFGTNGDNGLIRGVASVIGQEGEQNGFYRTILKKIPSALPFLTTSTRQFAFSALNQDFVVPGSCNATNLATINLPIFAPLTVETQNIAAKSQTLDFSISLPSNVTSTYGTNYTSYVSNLSLTYINQQNTPVVEQITNVKSQGNGVLTFQANFPFNGTTFGNGLTIAAVTKGASSFTSADAVAEATLFGPGLIEIN